MTCPRPQVRKNGGKISVQLEPGPVNSALRSESHLFLQEALVRASPAQPQPLKKGCRWTLHVPQSSFSSVFPKLIFLLDKLMVSSGRTLIYETWKGSIWDVKKNWNVTVLQEGVGRGSESHFRYEKNETPKKPNEWPKGPQQVSRNQITGSSTHFP